MIFTVWMWEKSSKLVLNTCKILHPVHPEAVAGWTLNQYCYYVVLDRLEHGEEAFSLSCSWLHRILSWGFEILLVTKNLVFSFFWYLFRSLCISLGLSSARQTHVSRGILSSPSPSPQSPVPTGPKSWPKGQIKSEKPQNPILWTGLTQ